MCLGGSLFILAPGGSPLKWDREKRVLLADSRPKTRLALRVLLERQPLVAVVGEAADGDRLLRLAEEAEPDIVLIDWDLPGAADGLLARLHSQCGSMRVVILSGRPEARQAALAAGADEFVSKTDPPECLLKAIEQAGSASPLPLVCENESV